MTQPDPTEPAGEQRPSLVLPLLLVASGAATLAQEAAWIRLLADVFGSSSAAAAIVGYGAEYGWRGAD